MKKQVSVRWLATTAMLSALAFALSYLEIPVAFLSPFLKLDLADIPALAALLSSGPLSGICVMLIKNLLCLLKSSTLGVGELANFVCGGAYLSALALVYVKKKDAGGFIIGAVCGVTALIAAGALMNRFVLVPLYEKLFHVDVGDLNMFIVMAVVPFNAIKGTVVSIVGFGLYKAISPFLKRRG